LAIQSDIGNETVQNYGVVTGNVDLGEGENAFNNHAGALFNPGMSVAIGPGNLFINDGTIDPGGAHNVLTTTISGNFVQSASGVFAVDVDGVNADRIDVIGTANLAGRVQPKVISLASTKQWTILTATEGVANNGITANNTAAARFGLSFAPTEMDLLLLGVNFVDGGGGSNGGGFTGQNRNQRAIATNLNQIFGRSRPSGFKRTRSRSPAASRHH
jgi:hypothetical protein